MHRSSSGLRHAATLVASGVRKLGMVPVASVLLASGAGALLAIAAWVSLWSTPAPWYRDSGGHIAVDEVRHHREQHGRLL